MKITVCYTPKDGAPQKETFSSKADTNSKFIASFIKGTVKQLLSFDVISDQSDKDVHTFLEFIESHMTDEDRKNKSSDENDVFHLTYNGIFVHALSPEALKRLTIISMYASSNMYPSQ